MTQTIDPVFSSAVLSAPELALNDLDFDALSQAMGGLKGEVDKNPQTAAIILAGGTGERFGKEGGKQLVEIAGKPIPVSYTHLDVYKRQRLHCAIISVAA